ncbi:MAG: FMN-binding glutamate synthase family protein, partial [Dokdonella sp.]
MHSLFPSRYWTFAIVVIAFIVSAWLWKSAEAWRVVAIFSGILVVVGIWDLAQTPHTLRRNYPLVGHIR